MSETGSDREGFAALMLRMRARGIGSKALFEAIENTPRASFVPAEFRDAVWSNRTVPIACGETLEACDFQAAMIAALDLQPGNRLLEIGTGSGYTSAVMARLCDKVLTLDRYKTLIQQAQLRHEHLGLTNIVARQSDGREGAAEGPFDRIIVWASFEELPRKFVDQLTSGGIMIAPIGPGEDVQTMTHLTKVGSRFEKVELETTRLQPLAAGVAEAI
ncbi:protein-L-isoaspartate(D-aspartate) O-methyltransferase [Nitratireductor basaltis]|uniref:Protein-L-isoaspartate O-methyltransferase n=1 Tax=Nitratireductor basaltis TaxID=472175 RepID=A0A084UAA0_9HYPH|nr:protein-L-isoaspartate(D-aspartate) O-methyltransferase [Nitratireductor basaltis]KFB09886.1 Protein-L-isoaspartate(D-aspartate) O-methyltransferase [Nitratireductor basaltis]